MKNKNVKLFSLESNLSSFPSYAICAVSQTDNKIRGESFLLAIFTGKKAKLIPMEIEFSNPLIDEKFVMEECLHQVKLDMLEIGKSKISHYDYPSLPFIQKVTEIEIEYLLHGLFSQDGIQNKIRKIGEITQVKELKKFIETLCARECVTFKAIKLE